MKVLVLADQEFELRVAHILTSESGVEAVAYLGEARSSVIHKVDSAAGHDLVVGYGPKAFEIAAEIGCRSHHRGRGRCQPRTGGGWSLPAGPRACHGRPVGIRRGPRRPGSHRRTEWTPGRVRESGLPETGRPHERRAIGRSSGAGGRIKLGCALGRGHGGGRPEGPGSG